MFPSTTALVRITAPAAMPITLAELKAHVREDSADNDDYLNSVIADAVDYIDAKGVLGRAMITQTWAQWVPQSPGDVRLLMGPFQALTSVEYYDAAGALQEAALADFETRLAGDFVICKPKKDREWPNADDRLDAIKITYRAGFGDAGADVPAGIRRALLLLAGHWFDNRHVVSEKVQNVVPMGVDALINNERVGWYG